MRLIDAHSAKESLECTLAGDAAGLAQRVIDRMPTIDAVPVVRCFDCIHRVYKDMGFDIGEVGGCALYGCAMPGDSFCSFGQKRKDGAE